MSDLFLSDINMLRQILFVAAFLVAKAAASLTECQVMVSNTCVQHCNNRSCDCGVKDSSHDYAKCNQVCTDAKCMAITCSSGTCYQECHNCHMECTSDVGFCRQRCLSGGCSFKCDATYCEQECSGGNCDAMVSDNCQIIIPRHYLVILAGLLFTISILSCLLLVLSFRKDNDFQNQGNYSKLRTLSSSVESVNSLPSFT